MIGRLGLVREKYLVETATPVTVTVFDPELPAVTVNVLVVPAVTLPNERVELDKTRVPVACVPEPPALTPWQPASSPMAANNNRVPAIFINGGGVFIFLAKRLGVPMRIWTPARFSSLRPVLEFR